MVLSSALTPRGPGGAGAGTPASWDGGSHAGKLSLVPAFCLKPVSFLGEVAGDRARLLLPVTSGPGRPPLALLPAPCRPGPGAWSQPCSPHSQPLGLGSMDWLQGHSAPPCPLGFPRCHPLPRFPVCFLCCKLAECPCLTPFPQTHLRIHNVSCVRWLRSAQRVLPGGPQPCLAPSVLPQGEFCVPGDAGPGLEMF